MLSLKLRLILILNAVFYALTQERRLTDGKVVGPQVPKRYVVYLSKAPSSPRDYDAWLCGGALVTNIFIVSSAACVEDVQHMYAIAGYSKRVSSQDLDKDKCTKAMKKKVVYTCVPKAYDFDYNAVEKWANVDIAAIKVESPYDFNSDDWLQLCSYKPLAIPINYEAKNQEPGLDAIVLGWGHGSFWRKPGVKEDYNKDTMHYAATRIHDKNECKKSYAEIRSMGNLIDKYMICTVGPGNIDYKGDLISTSKPIADGCTQAKQENLRGSIVCEEDLTKEQIPEFRKSFSKILTRQQNMTRKHGICQNDHGGPIVTWVGSHEVLIGVASVFRVTEDLKCTGPYLYTSTQCNGAFLDCVINGGARRKTKLSFNGKNDDGASEYGDVTNEDKTEIERDGDKTRRALCDKPPSEKGFDTIERKISWINHPDGAAENEIFQMRPQVSLNDYNFK